jgi:uncharacterized protein YbbK (DUF523 family)
MNSIYSSKTENSEIPRLLLSAKDAARAMAVCPRTLWSLSKPRGPIKVVRLGKRTLYSVDELKSYVRQQTEGQQQVEHEVKA